MNNIDPVQIKHPHIRTFVVPLFIYEAAMKANMHLMDLTVYSKLRKIASLEDIAQYAFIHDNIAVRNASGVLSTKINSLSLEIRLKIEDCERSEAEVVLDKLAKTKEIADVANSYLAQPPQGYENLYRPPVQAGVARQVPNRSLVNRLGTPAEARSDLPYQLKTSGSDVFIIVGPGFSTYVETSGRVGQAENFVRDFIRHCDGLFDSAEVAKHPLFATFVSSLAA